MTMDARSIEKRFREGVEANIASKRLLSADLGPCLSVASILIEAYLNGHGMIIFGNGGSAADAQHLAAELVGRFRHERRALRAQALTVNTSVLTAVGNDYSFDDVYARQLEAFGQPGDVAIGITTSGRSRNVVNGLLSARELGMTSVAMTGADGGPAADAADHWVAVPSTDTPRIQEAQIMIGHLWCELIESAVVESSDAELQDA
jgi:D-sedoheptulose 7-phosphate isomerase